AQRGSPESVRIYVGFQIYAFTLRILENFRHTVPGLVPHRSASQFDMADLDWKPGFPTDSCDLVIRIEHLICLVADMAYIEAAFGCCNSGELYHFLGGGEMAFFILQAARKSKSSSPQFHTQHIFHPLNLLGSGGTIQVFSHHPFANRGMAHHRGEIDGSWSLFETREEVGNRKIGV